QAGVVVVLRLRGREAMAGEDYGPGRLAGPAQGPDAEVLAVLQGDALAQRPGERQPVAGAGAGTGGDGERLIIAPLEARFEAGVDELAFDVLGRPFDALGGDAAPLAGVAGQEGQVCQQAGLDGRRGVRPRGPHQEGRQNEPDRHGPQAPTHGGVLREPQGGGTTTHSTAVGSRGATRIGAATAACGFYSGKTNYGGNF